jgi:hypothetical protein
MATENRWLRSNIRDRLVNPKAKFIVSFDHINYIPISFCEASKIVTEKIVAKYDNIYVPLSGGMDSEYVFNCFLGHKFTPIIVSTPANKEESSFAFNRCKSENVKPIVIEKTEAELLTTYYNEIYKKLNGSGINSTATYIAGKYADDHGGVAIIGEHGYDGFNEWDFYNDALIHEENSIYFFMYDIQIFAAMMKEFSDYDHHQTFKHRIYGVPLRKKMKYTYSKEFDSLFNQIRNFG